VPVGFRRHHKHTIARASAQGWRISRQFTVARENFSGFV
jgi:hypothetical protein